MRAFEADEHLQLVACQAVFVSSLRSQTARLLRARWRRLKPDTAARTHWQASLQQSAAAAGKAAGAALLAEDALALGAAAQAKSRKKGSANDACLTQLLRTPAAAPDADAPAAAMPALAVGAAAADAPAAAPEKPCRFARLTRLHPLPQLRSSAAVAAAEALPRRRRRRAAPMLRAAVRALRAAMRLAARATLQAMHVRPSTSRQ
jgi:hypothetical protein